MKGGRLKQWLSREGLAYALSSQEVSAISRSWTCLMSERITVVHYDLLFGMLYGAQWVIVHLFLFSRNA